MHLPKHKIDGKKARKSDGNSKEPKKYNIDNGLDIDGLMKDVSIYGRTAGVVSGGHAPYSPDKKPKEEEEGDEDG